MYQAKTIRRLPPTARKLARTINSCESHLRTLKRLLYELAEMERHAEAFRLQELKTLNAALEATGDAREDGRRALEAAAVRRLA